MTKPPAVYTIVPDTAPMIDYAAERQRAMDDENHQAGPGAWAEQRARIDLIDYQRAQERAARQDARLRWALLTLAGLMGALVVWSVLPW